MALLRHSLNAPETAVKIAILLFYKRIFSTAMFKVCVWFGIATISVWGTVFFCFTLTDARPVSEPWSGHVSLPYDATALGLAQVGTNIALDVIVLCFPLPVIARLHMPTNRKMAVALIFWLGVFCCVASVARLVLLKKSLAVIIEDPAQHICQPRLRAGINTDLQVDLHRQLTLQEGKQGRGRLG
ncbi:GPCR, PTH-type, partial [Metarhizium brunneum ARSEF 3297]